MIISGSRGAMPITLADWETRFAPTVGRIECPEGKVRAALLPVPDRGMWEEFLGSVVAEWKDWKVQLLKHPSCLLTLYCGLAYYEYDEHTFWPQFAKAVGPFSADKLREKELYPLLDKLGIPR